MPVVTVVQKSDVKAIRKHMPQDLLSTLVKEGTVSAESGSVPASAW